MSINKMISGQAFAMSEVITTILLVYIYRDTKKVFAPFTCQYIFVTINGFLILQST